MEITLSGFLFCEKSIDFTWNIITVYEDARPERKAGFCAELSRVYQNHTLPCVVEGDFNIIRNSYEKNKPNTPLSLKGFLDKWNDWFMEIMWGSMLEYKLMIT